MESRNYIAELNQYVQRTGSELKYEDQGSAGPDHDKIFTQRVVLNGKEYPEGVGRNKKQAKQRAAEHALIYLPDQQSVSFETQSQSVNDNSPKEINFIGLLNNFCQEKKLTPNYIQVNRSGQPHCPQFSYKVVIDDIEYPEGEGKSVKQAKQNAARLALSALQEQSDWDSKVSLRSTLSTDNPDLMSTTSTSTASSNFTSSSSSSDPTVSSSQNEPMSTSDSIVFADSSNPLDDQASLWSAVSEQTPSSLESAEPQLQSSAMASNDSDAVKNKSFTSTESRFTSEFDSIKLLGEGGFGSVYKAREKLLDKNYAVKVVRSKKKALREVKALSDLAHENIVRYYNCWMEDTGYKMDWSADNSHSSRESSPQFLYIKMELCDSKTVKHWIKERNSKTCHDSERRRESLHIAQQIVRGIEYIHSKNLIHRDLKPANIMFGQDGVVKIGDFGLVTVDADNNDPVERTVGIGTFSYMAPEQLENIYARKVDIFAFGLIYIELLWKISTGHERVEVFKDASNQKFPEKFPSTFLQEMGIIKLMLCKEPQQRAEASTLKAELDKLALVLDPQDTEHQRNVTV